MPIIDLNGVQGAFSDQVVEARRFFLGPSAGARPPVVIGGGFERVSEAYTVERSRVPYVVLELVVGGEGTADLGGETVALRPGTLFVYGERTPHRLTTSPRRPLVKYFLDLDGPRSRRLLRDLTLADGAAWQVRQWLDLARLFEEIIRHGTGGGPNRHAVCDALLRALLLHAAQSVVPQQEASDAADSYQRCCTLIDTAYRRLRSLNDLAAAAGLDAAYVCRLFKRFDQESPYRRLSRRRMTAAAAELYDGRASVRDVAESLGYSDAFHFSRLFKSIMGTPPSVFRRPASRRPLPNDATA